MAVPPCGDYGDVSGDGTVGMSDVQLIEKHVLGVITLTPDQIKRADVNGDGDASMADAQLITQFVVGEITTFPVCGVAPPTEITCNGTTPHYPSGCALLKHYENTDRNCEIDPSGYLAARTDESNGLITAEEFAFVRKVYREYDGSINDVCPGCCTALPPPIVCTPGEKVCQSDAYLKTCKPDGTGWSLSVCYSGTKCEDGECVPVATPTPPPNMETRTVSLTEGTHTIQVSLNGYDTLNATINVTSTGVACVSVIGGACGGSGLPRVETSGLTVSTYLKEAATTSDVCTWMDSIGGWQNLQWSSHVLEAYYVYIGAGGHSVGFSPVTWDDVLGLYYYYINDPTAGNAKTGCGT